MRTDIYPSNLADSVSATCFPDRSKRAERPRASGCSSLSDSANSPSVFEPPCLPPAILARDRLPRRIGRGLEAEPLLDQAACRLVERRVAARPADAAPADPAIRLDGEAHLDLAADIRPARFAGIVAVADRPAPPYGLGAAAGAAARS